MADALTERLREFLAAVVRFVRPTPETDGSQGEGGDPDPPGPSYPGPTYNGLVEKAMASDPRTRRMDLLDRHRTQDQIRLLKAQNDGQQRLLRTVITYGTASVVVVLACVGGVVAVAGAVGITSPLGLGSLIVGPMSLITGLWYRMGKLVAQYTAAAQSSPVLSADRRAVAPERTSGDQA